MSEPANLAWYVYALLNAGSNAPAVEGILPGATVDIVPVGSFAVLTSLVPRALFDRNHADNQTGDPAWTADRAAAHHRVTCMASFAQPCLPLAFGTLFSSLGLLADWLQPRTANLMTALREINGHAEWCVAIEENQAQHAAWLNRNDVALQRLACTAEDVGVGAAFLLSKRIDKARAAGRSAHLKVVETQIDHALRLTRCPVIAERRRDGTPSWSLLGPEGEAGPVAVAAVVAALVKEIAPSGLTLRLTGPWPAYAFARAALQRDAAHV